MASVLALVDAKTYLGNTDATDDAKLQGIIDSAEAILAQQVGPLQSTARTDRVPGNCYTLVLRVTPVISLTSVTGFTGGALTISDLHVESRSGTVTFNTGMCFAQPYYDVVYNAGRSTCPTDLLLAAKELVRHLWEPQRGPLNVLGGTPSTSPAAYLLPYRVQELITPHLQPGFA